MTILDEHPEGLSHFTCWWLVRGEKTTKILGTRQYKGWHGFCSGNTDKDSKVFVTYALHCPNRLPTWQQTRLDLSEWPTLAPSTPMTISYTQESSQTTNANSAVWLIPSIIGIGKQPDSAGRWYPPPSVPPCLLEHGFAVEGEAARQLKATLHAIPDTPPTTLTRFAMVLVWIPPHQ